MISSKSNFAKLAAELEGDTTRDAGVEISNGKVSMASAF